MNYGCRFMTLYRRQGSRPSPRKKMGKSKMVVMGKSPSLEHGRGPCDESFFLGVEEGGKIANVVGGWDRV